MIICPLHWYLDPVRLEEVVETMLERGAPTLRGHIDRETGVALLREGTHRIHAANRIGLAPRIVPVSWWRSAAALDRARVAAVRRGLSFDRVEVLK